MLLHLLQVLGDMQSNFLNFRPLIIDIESCILSDIAESFEEGNIMKLVVACLVMVGPF